MITASVVRIYRRGTRALGAMLWLSCTGLVLSLAGLAALAILWRHTAALHHPGHAVARAVLFVATLPPRAAVPELVILPSSAQYV